MAGDFINVGVKFAISPAEREMLANQVRSSVAQGIEMATGDMLAAFKKLSRVKPITFKFNPADAQEFYQRAQTHFSQKPILVKVQYVTGNNAGSVAGDLRQRTSTKAGAKAEMGALAEGTKKAGKAAQEAGTAFDGFAGRVGFSTIRIGAYLLAIQNLLTPIRLIRAAKDTIISSGQDINKLTQILEGNVDKVNTVVGNTLTISKNLGVSGKELLGITNLLAQSGEKFANTAQLAAATDALAKTQLSATFGNLNETSAGAIAFLNQFNKEGKELVDILDVANKLSKNFAVESGDIFTAVQTGGAAFSALGGSLEEFQAVVTAARQLTRLSASTIGTSLNTIVVRLFRKENLDVLRDMGVQVKDNNGDFKSFVDILKDAGKAFQDLPSETKASIAESLFGVRQSKLGIKLLQDAGKETGVLSAALDQTKNAQGSLERDALIGLKRIDIQFQKVGESFFDTFVKMGQEQGLKDFLGDLATSLKTIANLLNSVSGLLPTFLKIGTAAVAGVALKNLPAFFGEFSGSAKVKAGRGKRRKSGDDALSIVDDVDGTSGAGGAASVVAKKPGVLARLRSANQQFNTDRSMSTQIFNADVEQSFARERSLRRSGGLPVSFDDYMRKDNNVKAENRLIHASRVTKQNARSGIGEIKGEIRAGIDKQWGESLTGLTKNRKKFNSILDKFVDGVPIAKLEKTLSASQRAMFSSSKGLSNTERRQHFKDVLFQTPSDTSAFSKLASPSLLLNKPADSMSVEPTMRDVYSQLSSTNKKKYRIASRDMDRNEKKDLLMGGMFSGSPELATPKQIQRATVSNARGLLEKARGIATNASEQKEILAANQKGILITQEANEIRARLNELKANRSRAALVEKQILEKRAAQLAAEQQVLNEIQKERKARAALVAEANKTKGQRGFGGRLAALGSAILPPVPPGDPPRFNRFRNAASRGGKAALLYGAFALPDLLMSGEREDVSSIMDPATGALKTDAVERAKNLTNQQARSGMVSGAVMGATTATMMGGGLPGAVAGAAIGGVIGHMSSLSRATEELRNTFVAATASIKTPKELNDVLDTAEKIGVFKRGMVSDDMSEEFWWGKNGARENGGDSWKDLGEIAARDQLAGKDPGMIGSFAKWITGTRLDDPTKTIAPQYFSQMQKDQKKLVLNQLESGEFNREDIRPRLMQAALEQSRALGITTNMDPEQVAKFVEALVLSQTEINKVADEFQQVANEAYRLRKAFPDIVYALRNSMNDRQTAGMRAEVGTESFLRNVSTLFGENIGSGSISSAQQELLVNDAIERFSSGALGPSRSRYRTGGMENRDIVNSALMSKTFSRDESNFISSVSEMMPGLTEVFEKITRIADATGGRLPESDKGNINAIDDAISNFRNNNSGNASLGLIDQTFKRIQAEGDRDLSQFVGKSGKDAAKESVRALGAEEALQRGVVLAIQEKNRQLKIEEEMMKRSVDIYQKRIELFQGEMNVIRGGMDRNVALGRGSNGVVSDLDNLIKWFNKDGVDVQGSTRNVLNARSNVVQAEQALNDARADLRPGQRPVKASEISKLEQDLLNSQKALTDANNIQSGHIAKNNELQRLLNDKFVELIKSFNEFAATRQQIGRSDLSEVRKNQLMIRQFESRGGSDLFRGVGDLKQFMEKIQTREGRRSLSDFQRNVGSNRLFAQGAANAYGMFGGDSVNKEKLSSSDAQKIIEIVLGLSDGLRGPDFNKNLEELISRFNDAKATGNVLGDTQKQVPEMIKQQVDYLKSISQNISTFLNGGSTGMSAAAQSINRASGVFAQAAKELDNVATRVGDIMTQRKQIDVNHTMVISGADKATITDPMIQPMIIKMLSVLASNLPNTLEGQAVRDAINKTRAAMG